MNHASPTDPTARESLPGQSLPGLSPQQALERACGIAAAVSVEQVWARFTAAVAAFGFERVNYGFTRYRVGLGIGDPLDAMFLSTHALKQVRWFHESGLYLRSADYRWVRENDGACSWGWVHDERVAGRLSAGECEVMDRLGQGRRRAGMTVSFPVGAPRSKGAMGLAGPDGATQAQVDAHWARHEPGLMALCNMAHLRLSQMPLPVLRSALTERQREILEWIADGKSLQDVCTLTELSMSAVDKHLRRARDRLAVDTTAQAVAKVSFLNQLFVTGERPADL
jgi:DNA-binding CsgD family transcriptional regulator